MTKKIRKNIKNAGIVYGNLKDFFVSRLFWGRSNFYKNVIHIMILVTTISLAVSGVAYRIYASSKTNELEKSDSIIGYEDLLSQGANLNTVLKTEDSGTGLRISKYTILPTDSLDSISKKFGISIDTIRWANPNTVSPFSNDIQIGSEISIPEINGVLHEVKSGETVDSIISLTSTPSNPINKYDVLEFNNLKVDSDLQQGQKIFIPDGNLVNPDIQVEGIPRGIFVNPLTECPGYHFERGFTGQYGYGHNGVDLSRWPDCPVVAAAAGTVTFAGYSYGGEGINVRINHGGGIVTHYYHGSQVYVRAGDRVQQGQVIMETGCTGNCTGDHLHFSLFKNGTAVDPEPYVPY